MTYQQARFYSSDAAATTLTASLGATGNPSVASIAGLPTSYPFTMLIDWGVASQEAISVTSAPTGGGPWSLPCTRGIDNSTGGAGGVSHSSGATIVHGVTAQDFNQPLQYIDGLSGFPWQFNIVSYGGAVGNGQCVTDGVMTATSPNLACTTSTPFAAGDVGKTIVVQGAGVDQYSPLVTTILTFTDSGHVVLNTNAGTSVSGGFGWVTWFTDDTAAIQSTVNAAATYAQANTGNAEVIIPQAPNGQFFGVGAGLTHGGTTFGNAQVTIPVIGTADTSENTVTLTIRGMAHTSGIPNWRTRVPWFNGSAIFSSGVYATAAAQSTNIGTYGNGAVIGGPNATQGYGAVNLDPADLEVLYSNMLIVIEDLQVVVPLSKGLSYSAFDFSGIQSANLFESCYGANTTYAAPAGWSTGTYITELSAGTAIGCLLPGPSNQENNRIRGLSCYGGYECGIQLTEHTVVEWMQMMYCYTTMSAAWSYTNSAGSLHALYIGQVTSEDCRQHLRVIGTGTSNIGPEIYIGQYDVEFASTLNLVDNNSGVGLAAARGRIFMTGKVITGVDLNGSAISASSQTGIKIILETATQGVVASPPSPPGSTTPQVNTYGRDCWIYPSVSGGSITAISVDGTSLGVTTGPIYVPGLAHLRHHLYRCPVRDLGSILERFVHV